LEIREVRGISVSDPIRSLIDVAPASSIDELENLLGAADRLGLLTPQLVIARLNELGEGPGVGRLRAAVERRTLLLTDSHLERLFVPIARRAGLGKPQTQAWVNGYRVDFYWPDLGLIVETDGLKYHRTPAQQTIDAKRDQAHTAAGLTPLRFSHAQVARSPGSVERILRQTAKRLSGH
jgi:very-short-patch-repair endonuclease